MSEISPAVAPERFEDTSNRELVFDAEEMREFAAAFARELSAAGCIEEGGGVLMLLDRLFPEHAPHRF